MTPDQMFVIAVLTLIIPVITGITTIVGGVILFNQQNRKLEAATRASEKAETAANHSKEVVTALQENFKAVMTIIAPEAAAAVAATMPAPSNDQATPITDAREAGEALAQPAALRVQVVNPEPLPVTETKSGDPPSPPAAKP